MMLRLSQEVRVVAAAEAAVRAVIENHQFVRRGSPESVFQKRVLENRRCPGRDPPTSSVSFVAV